jgi:hypothetical protein
MGIIQALQTSLKTQWESKQYIKRLKFSMNFLSVLPEASVLTSVKNIKGK